MDVGRKLEGTLEKIGGSDWNSDTRLIRVHRVLNRV